MWKLAIIALVLAVYPASAASLSCNSDTCIHGECKKLAQADEEYECYCDRGWDGDMCDQKLPVHEVFVKKPAARDNDIQTLLVLSKDKIRLYVTLVLAVLMGLALTVSTYMLWKKSQRSYRPPVELEHRPSKGKIVAQSQSVASPSHRHQQTV